MKSSLADVLRLLLQHLAVADDGVQRRAQLVAHVGQEGALGFVRFLGGMARFLKLEVLALKQGQGFAVLLAVIAPAAVLPRAACARRVLGQQVPSRADPGNPRPRES